MRNIAGKILLCLGMLVLFVPAGPMAAKKFQGLEMPDTLSANNTELVLNGVGMRTKYNIIDVYAGALYLQKDFTSRSSELNGAEVISADEPMAIRMHIVTGLASKQKMATAFRSGFDSSTGGNTEQLKDKIESFISAFQTEELNKSDIFDIFYLPEKGLEIYKQSKKIKTIESGIEFKKAVFGIWLSNDPAQVSLKKRMLGNDS